MWRCIEWVCQRTDFAELHHAGGGELEQVHIITASVDAWAKRGGIHAGVAWPWRRLAARTGFCCSYSSFDISCFIQLVQGGKVDCHAWL